MIPIAAEVMAWTLKHQIEAGWPLEPVSLDALIVALGGSPTAMLSMNPEQKMFYAVVLTVCGASRR